MTSSSPPPRPDATRPHRDILRLALPALATLIAEPLFLLADSAIVGHLGTAELAGLGVASAALLTMSGVFVFLAYGTTSLVARRIGAGQERLALDAGLDGMWLAALLGLVTAVVTAVFARDICGLFGAGPAVVDEATTYLRISAFGLPGMLIVLASTGVLRGFLDTRTPLVVAGFGFGANIVLNLVLVYPVGLGLAGSAWGTAIAQNLMALALGLVVVHRALAAGASLRPHLGGVARAALGGLPLLVRTLALRGAMLATTWVAAGMGEVPVAAHQVAMTVFSFLAFALDALAIAGQALTGSRLGAGDVPGTRAATRIMLWWGLWSGVVLGLIVVALHRVLPPLFTPDPQVQQALAAALLVLALGQPIAGLVFVLDGVLIGAGDGRVLAYLQVVALLAYLPILWWVHQHAPAGATAALTVLWWSFTAFMALRLVGLALRARTDRWLVTGLGHA